MTFTITGMLHLQPFDEFSDHRDASPLQVGAIGIGLTLDSVLAITAFGLAFAGIFNWSFKAYGAYLAVSILTELLEWQAGLKAKALNDLFSAVVCTCALALTVLILRLDQFPR